MKGNSEERGEGNEARTHDAGKYILRGEREREKSKKKKVDKTKGRG